MQRLDYLHEPGHNLVIVPGESKEGSELSDSGGGGPFFDNPYFLFISHYILAGDNVPQVCDLSVEELGSSFKSGLFQLLEHGLPPHEVAGCILKKMTMSLRYMMHQLRLRSPRQVSINF